MNRTLMVAFVAVAALVGCNKSETGGGAGSDTFKLVGPATSVDVKQGEVQTARLSVERGDGFKQSLKLELKAPKGLDVDPTSTTLKAGEKGEAQLKITAANDAPLGDHKIMVKGTPEKGEPTNLEIKVNVIAK